VTDEFPTREAPFDTVSKDYDRLFSQTTLGQWLRSQVQEKLARHFSAGDHILELGCGTGEDALWLASREIKVTATDQSMLMLEQTQSKISAAGITDLVQTLQLDLNDMQTDFQTKFDGLFANFGVLNCVEDRPLLARKLAGWLRPGGKAVFVVMNPICPWEFFWYLAHGQPGKATRRFHQQLSVSLPGNQRIEISYPGPRRIASEFSPSFQLRSVQGLGTFLPPSYLSPLLERYPRIFKTLYWLEKRTATAFPWTRLNDHYVVIVQRTQKEVMY